VFSPEAVSAGWGSHNFRAPRLADILPRMAALTQQLDAVRIANRGDVLPFVRV
jgi:hypothetical protein